LQKCAKNPKKRNLPKIFQRSFENVAPGFSARSNKKYGNKNEKNYQLKLRQTEKSTAEQTLALTTASLSFSSNLTDDTQTDVQTTHVTLLVHPDCHTDMHTQ